MSVISGSCLCGEIKFEAKGEAKLFQYCHCARCRKVSGTAHASNIFVDPEQLTWLSGEDSLQRFELPEAKYFATTFCKKCGSKMPWITQAGTNMIIPAGCVDSELPIKPKMSIFWGSRAQWYEMPCDLPLHEELPPRKK